MAIDWGIVMNALGRGLEGGVQGYQMGKQWERQKQQDAEQKAFRDWQQRETTMARLDRAGERAQQNLQRQAAIEANQRAQQAAVEKEARELQATRATALSVLGGLEGGAQYADRLPADFDPKALEPIIKQLSTPAPARNIDPLSPEGIAAYAQRADASARAQARYREPRAEPTPESASTRDQRLTRLADQAVQAAGGDPARAAQLLVDSPSTRNIFSEGMGSMHLKAAADRYHQAAARSSGAPGGSFADYLSRREVPAAAPTATAPTPPARGLGAPTPMPGDVGPITLGASRSAPQESPADMWERLVAGGMDPDEATEEVRRRLGLP